ncbi:hypothetical protein [Persicirhabdus sediminis]|nr:hypothetical protein [Persicirhabdus sediminis]
MLGYCFLDCLKYALAIWSIVEPAVKALAEAEKQQGEEMVN